MRISDWSSDVCSSDLDCKIGSTTLWFPPALDPTGSPSSRRCATKDGRVRCSSSRSHVRTVEIEASLAMSGRLCSKIGRAHVCIPVTNAHLVCRLLLEKKHPKHSIPTLHRTKPCNAID